MGEGLNAGPFLAAAYGIAAVMIIGYTVLQLQLRRRLRQLENATLEGG